MSIKVSSTGDFSRTVKILRKVSSKAFLKLLESYGKKGVEALQLATPKDTGKTADSWSYKVLYNDTGISIIFSNSNLSKAGIPIAMLIYYGHAMPNGAYVEGIDYLNPAIQPLFKKMANDIWVEVKSN